MIERYTLPEMDKIWAQENKYQKWLDVELAVCEYQAEKGVIPQDAWKNIKEKAKNMIKNKLLRIHTPLSILPIFKIRFAF